LADSLLGTDKLVDSSGKHQGSETSYDQTNTSFSVAFNLPFRKLKIF